ncbi:MAG: hypothetical protein V4469_03615 [Patescibacteria group bacterium]
MKKILTVSIIITLGLCLLQWSNNKWHIVCDLENLQLQPNPIKFWNPLGTQALEDKEFDALVASRPDIRPIYNLEEFKSVCGRIKSGQHFVNARWIINRENQWREFVIIHVIYSGELGIKYMDTLQTNNLAWITTATDYSIKWLSGEVVINRVRNPHQKTMLWLLIVMLPWLGYMTIIFIPCLRWLLLRK